MALETVPKDLRHLRACLLCSLVKTIDQFEYDGCDNCDAYLQMKGNREMVYDCTSSSFDGYVFFDQDFLNFNCPLSSIHRNPASTLLLTDVCLEKN
ncbi:unnamed protein product [Ranitomeya imitator]|uniref:Spt4/RpoE2 zinc finger domain-containing protein n=1 Tax=Ranitomeya imitator TaxID=111125 RepID=A0ABN9KVR2_9NEOB|nr:unnamed protein product [Ranitomeya imitator]